MQTEALDRRIAPGAYVGEWDFRGRSQPLPSDHDPPDPEASHEMWRDWISAEAGRLGVDLNDCPEAELTGAA